MPTSGTHITIVQRVAADPKYGALLGNPDPTLPETDPEAVKMRFACLGAVGPDIFYALADYGSELQDLENVLVKIDGTFECLSSLMGKVDRYIAGLESDITLGVVDSIKTTVGLVSGVMTESVLALLASGVNLWPVFEPARQKDLPRNSWYWADYLHYVRSGRFVRTLLDKSKGDPNLHAYALGYLTHYVTDTVGHPYVNQVVGAPWRLAWQRHHLVENFMDAYVWDRWHAAPPPPATPPPPPSSAEPPLDKLVAAPNAVGAGAPFTFARLNDLTNIGTISLGDPIDDAIDKICKSIEQGLFDLGVVEMIEPPSPTDADFKAWTVLVADAMAETYTQAPALRPMNLASGVLGGGVSRPDGRPTADDVGAAYGVFRVILKISTEEKILEPKPPNIVADISAIVKQVTDAIAADLAGIPGPPSIPMGGSFSASAMLDALTKAAEWAGQVAAAVAKAVADALAGIVAVTATALSDAIKYLLFLLNKALFALYRSIRDVLVLKAYAIPYTEEITGTIGSIALSSLWRSMGDSPPGSFPHEELVAQRTIFGSSYDPTLPPTSSAELPAVLTAAPYKPLAGPGVTAAPKLIPTLPDDFIDAPLGPDDMFRASGPQKATKANAVETFGAAPKNFGGAIANSKKGIDIVEAGFPRGTSLPDYNLDGDRGYAWPCWDVQPRPTMRGTSVVAGDPLAPDAPANAAAGVATVHAVKAPS